MTFRNVAITVGTVLLVLWTPSAAMAQPDVYPLKVLPPEHAHVVDPVTGARLTFITTSPAKDTNLYFHERSWLADGSMVVFISQREDGGLMGYLTATGELVRIATPTGGVGQATASLNRRSVFATRGKDVLELTFHIELSSDPKVSPSKVTAAERHICTPPFPSLNSSLNESCDGQWLSLGFGPYATGDAGIMIIRVSDGQTREVCRAGDPPGYGSHVQWSRTNPNLLSFAGIKSRLWVVDIRDGVPRNVYRERPGEYATHESWWVDDQLLFCGGIHPRPTEDGHVKVLDPHTGVVRIIGEGAWWPGATPAELAKRNWWHAAGSADGRWVVADNWHGDIMLFEAKTTRPRLLTGNHRTYGKGEHPHVGWDRKSQQVVFTSHQRGNPDVCIATIPQAWQTEDTTCASPATQPK